MNAANGSAYSARDEAFARRLYADLQKRGVCCWFAPSSLQGGKKLHEQIDEAIRACDRFLLIISEASMKSEWVRTEIAKAFQKEPGNGKSVLFPIRLVPFEAIRAWEMFDPHSGKDLAREIGAYYISDFSDWKNRDDYQRKLERLLKDLEAEDP